mmetsp:Transcript_25085/g.52149  ORF Transcript_25085/g.52149 Transcript_25085/m.52149 type:complete len:563 (-) Transcript_25085:168-1856(-)|eukprot:CAMPEP_0172443228 /NCGR_PEP_ID=MMETSP1065-20121228/3524_1 /TAXON_ID=265537 /ORGANISM="Amphiprora paludosa, Strain CCMP125" /LENGTH=562 /DNA_ID=CAMNT_0013193387 /DNA_START=190 /DNA_END=1878 /DNA_ORIENTATION=-
MSTNQAPNEKTPLRHAHFEGTTSNVSTEYQSSSSAGESSNDDETSDDEGQIFYEQPLQSSQSRREMRMADRLSVRLLAAQEDSEEEDRILSESLKLEHPPSLHNSRRSFVTSSFGRSGRFRDLLDNTMEEQEQAQNKLQWMGLVLLLFGIAILVGIGYGAAAVIEIRPPLQPVGPYRLIERQEGMSLFDAYTFYEGKDSVGSNGYNMYVGQAQAEGLGIINMTMEDDVLDIFYANDNDDDTVDSDGNLRQRRRAQASTGNATTRKQEPFVYVGSSPTKAGPRDSIRLEGKRFFDRGLFILDVRHMPAGCGVWPAFWLVDEPNWPVNGEIDIVEGVNYQTEAKTAMHSTRGCKMDDIPLGTMTGTWDTAQGIPDAKTGIPDMTLRYAQNCFVYDPHQWLNQGCVAVDQSGGTIGVPLNEKGGGVYVLEWDPMNRHIRSWVFTPHTSVPENLVQAIRTANEAPEKQVVPDPDDWPVPYAYFAIGKGTNCASDHFRHMHLVLNTAFCGSVAGNRYHMDCTKEQTTQFPTCKEYIKSNPKEIRDEAYWKIRGVYVYEREWERTWIT